MNQCLKNAKRLENSWRQYNIERSELVFDEPASGLDYRHMEQTARLIASLKDKTTTFIVTHDPELIVRCCTHILHLENGSVEEYYELNQEGKNSEFSL